MFTTSRYASLQTRKYAKGIAKEKDESYFNRGKHTISELVEKARKMGEEYIHIIEEKDKKPAVISTLIINEIGEWKWISEEKIK